MLGSLEDKTIIKRLLFQMNDEIVKEISELSYVHKRMAD